MERHRQLKYIARSMYVVPGMKLTVRALTRFAIQHVPLSLKNKQRLYNFFAKDTVPPKSVSCSAPLPCGKLVRLKLTLRDDLSRVWYYWGYTGYEKGTTRLFCELLKSKSCIFDIGANIGYYAILAAALVGSRGEVHAFEPWPDVFHWLSQNARLNGVRCLHLNQVALSDKDGQGRLFLPSNLAWSNASLIEGFTDQQEQITIEMVRFDTYCARNGIRPVDLVKLDVEGAELKVLRGMGALLDAWSPDIICEVLQPFEQDLDIFFLDKAYRKFLITDGGLEEVEKIRAHPRFRDYYLSRAPISLD